jgi:diguanylate cyclase (GGDEF)-like protein
VFGKNALFLQSNKSDQKSSIDFCNSKNNANGWQGEIWRHHKYEDDFPTWTTINEVKDAQGQVTHYIYVFMDITRLNKIHNQLSFMAYHDPLTKLPNRLLVKDRITHALQSAKRDDETLAVLFLDLDRFKSVNDTYGHEVGDLMLKEVAKRINNTVRKEDTVSRYAGDEFIVVMEKIPDIKSPAKLAQKLIDSLTAPVYINGNQLYISASIGISLFPSDGCYADTLVKAADAAMFRAKKKGRNNYQYFSPQLKTENLESISMESACSLYG